MDELYIVFRLAADSIAMNGQWTLRGQGAVARVPCASAGRVTECGLHRACCVGIVNSCTVLRTNGMRADLRLIAREQSPIGCLTSG